MQALSPLLQVSRQAQKSQQPVCWQFDSSSEQLFWMHVESAQPLLLAQLPSTLYNRMAMHPSLLSQLLSSPEQ